MKKIYLLTIILALSVNLKSQVHWTKHPDNPVMVPGTPGEWDEELLFPGYPGSVIFYDSIYHMWPTGNWISIGHATSPDGVTWTKDINSPVLVEGPDGDWDENSVYTGGVLVIDSIFHMWYSGHSGLDITANHRIGHATSPDGVTWTKDTVNNPVLDMGPGGTWDEGWVAPGSVIFNGSEYHMWYSGHGVTGSGVQFGHATSPNGVTWTKDPSNPVLINDTSWESTRIDAPMVIFDGTTYRMWYTGGGQDDSQIGYATSEDGSVWTKYDNNPVLRKGSTGSWDVKSVAFCSVIDSSGVKYKLWYGGSQSDGTGSIGYAESDTRVPYLSLISSKPVYDSTDTVVAEIVLDGIIYIVPEGTSSAIDSILKYKVASADALANTEAKIPLTDLSIGTYTILGVSSMGFVSTNPLLLEVVADAAPPSLTLESDIVNEGDTIFATSTKDGTIFLVNEGQSDDLSMIRLFLIDSLTAQANIPVEFPTDGLSVKEYWLYAVDIYEFISKPDTVTIVSGPDGVEENINTGISIYPNPANDLIIIETNKVGQYFIELNSINGQLIYGTKMEGPTHQIDLSSFQKGLYFITIRSRDYVRTEKIIKL